MKSVLVTGSTNGLGKAICQTYLEKGWKVVGLDIEISGINHKNYSHFEVDVTSEEQLIDLKCEVDHRGIKINTIVNNAGIFRFIPVTDSSKSDLLKIIELNGIAPFYVIRTFLDHLIENQGCVVQISSENVKISGIFQPYPSSKILLESLSTAARQELGLHRINLVIIEPGAIDTRLLNWNDFENERSPYFEYIRNLVSRAKGQVKKPVNPKKVANLVYRVSQLSSPKRVYRINHGVIVSLLSMLPQSLQDYIMMKSVK